MKIKAFNNEVLFAAEANSAVGPRELKSLKTKVVHNKRKRIRLCMHRDVDDNLHEMLIVLTKDAYIRPHKHLTKVESYHVIEGLADLIGFDDAGCVTETVRLGDHGSGHAFYYRTSSSGYHTLLVRSDFLVFHETTNGPFNQKDSIAAPWAPDDQDQAAGRIFMKRVARTARSLTGKQA